MRQIIKTLYLFSELPTEEAKERARDWLREGIAQDFDAECTVYEFATTLHALGFDVGCFDMSHGEFDFRKPVDILRAFVRYETHGGYIWAAVLADGGLLCEECALENYGQVYRATRDGDGDQWRVVGITHSGESEETEYCSHCHELRWSIGP